MTIPNTELEAPGVLCRTQHHGDYQITYHPGQARFTLWHHDAGGPVKVATSTDIQKLYAKVPWITK